MDNNSTYEQEIDLKDLMFAVLHKWRPIILVAVVLAVLLGGFKAITTYKSQNDPEKVKEAEEKYQEDLEIFAKKRKPASVRLQT